MKVLPLTLIFLVFLQYFALEGGQGITLNAATCCNFSFFQKSRLKNSLWEWQKLIWNKAKY